MKNSPEIYCVITIDTEADHSVSWKKSRPLTFNSITYSIPESLQPLFRKYNAIGTYLLTVEVLENEKALGILKGIKECELGTHLHPEYIAPDKEFLDYSSTYSSRFTHNYPLEIESKKIQNITGLFSEKIGYSPLVYRGGKFAFGQNTAATLLGLGYSVDTSVTPAVSWKKIGGPDFRKFPDQPYRIEGNGKNGYLLEVPVTINFLNPLKRILNRPTWLRPSFTSGNLMKKLINKFIASHSKNKFIVLNIMFHSMEFFPEASPYSRTREDCTNLINRLEEVLAYCGSIGAKFCKLSHIKTIL